MVTKKESIRIEYKPLSTSESISTITGNRRQTYDVNTGYFQPDRRLDPLQVLVTCNIYDAHKLVEGVVNESLTDVMWKVTDTTGKLVVIQNTDKQFRIGQGADKALITIFKNIPDLEETTIEFTARYMEPKSKRVTNFQTTFSLVTVTEAVAQNQLQLTAPVGTVQFPFVNNKGLVLQADLMRAGKKVPAAYWWSKDGKEIANEAQDKLVVTSLTKAGGVYQVEVADCSVKFNELVSDKVEADKDVIEWRGLYSVYPLNVLKESNRPSYFVAYNGSSVVRSTEKVVEWGDKEVNRCVFKGGDTSFKALCQIGIIPEGVIASWSVNIKNNGDKVISIASNMGGMFSRVEPKNNVRIKFENVVGNGVGVSQFQVRGMGFNESDELDFTWSDIKFEYNVASTKWSPSKFEMENLISEKTDFYVEQTTLPPNYRPTPKPATLYKKETFLKRSLGDYDVEILYPKVVDADADSVRFEAVFTNNRGSIPDSDKYFDVGWWMVEDGSFEYKGLVINVPMAKLQTLIAAGKGVEYTITEK